MVRRLSPKQEALGSIPGRLALNTVLLTIAYWDVV